MVLKSIQVKYFRNIINSTEVEINKDITCLVGKNESGKTAFLHALYRLNPSRKNVSFSVPDQYPAWLEKRDRMKGKNLENEIPVKVRFILSEDDIKEISELFGENFIKNGDLAVSITYNNKHLFEIDIEVSRFVSHIVNSIEWPKGTKTAASKCKSIEELKSYSQELTTNTDLSEEQRNVSVTLNTEIDNRLHGKSIEETFNDFLQNKIPKFLYMSEYSTLPYSVEIKKILSSDQSVLTDSELTARSLLMLAAAEKEYLDNPDYERRKRELENVANALTQDVLKYWSQNPELRVSPDLTQKTVSVPNGRASVIDELKIRIWDQRHQLSLPFDEHSTGFRWFFSFLAAFSEYEYNADPVIILLDEPALGLHAKAQSDFLRFIEDRLSQKCQVIYTTHSPFMIQPGKLERIRLVEDKGQELGTVITKDVTSTDSDTIFPLQGALGYDLVQNLFISKNNIIVEGTSDFTYIQILSDYFKESSHRESLNDNWSLLPVGGVDLIPTFAALLGNHLDVTVLIDAQKGGHQKLNKLKDQKILTENKIITIGDILSVSEADIEDLFDPNDYLNIYNESFKSNLQLNDLNGKDPIVRRIARHLSIDRFDHGKPADLFLRKRDVILNKLTDITLDNFERLFKKLNSTFEE